MGFKQPDLTPFLPTGPTPNIPPNKDIQCKAFQVLRTDTVSTLKCALPGDASILNITMSGSVVSNAGTTATVSLVASNNTGAISTGTAVDVKGTGATTQLVQMPGLPNIEPIPLTGDIRITATYAETGAASSAGGPWTFVVSYIR